MNKLITLALIVLFSSLTYAQNYKKIGDNYDKFKEPTLKDRWFIQDDILPLIESLGKDVAIRLELRGYSWEKRPIQTLTIGTGPVKVFLWSQMHGDEPTATGALFDLLNWFTKDKSHKSFKRDVLKKLTIIVLPMLNPDGAERHQRRTALGIDMNRDALKLNQPESQILKDIIMQFKPKFGFNLHDQGRVYGAGIDGQPASLSFLAPAFDRAKSINIVRGDAIKLVSGLVSFLDDYIPNGIGKYDDAFEPRAFGDNIQKWGTSTILIESGSYKGDPERQYVRKLNFLTMIKALELIKDKKYALLNFKNYNNLPFNERNYVDKIYRGLRFDINKKEVIFDLAFQRGDDGYNAKDLLFNYYLKDKGDLSVFRGYEDIDLKDYSVQFSEVFDKTIDGVDDLNDDNLRQLISKGIGFIRVNNINQMYQHLTLPILFIPHDYNINSSLNKSLSLSLSLYKKGKIKKVICRGILYDL